MLRLNRSLLTSVSQHSLHFHVRGLGGGLSTPARVTAQLRIVGFVFVGARRYALSRKAILTHSSSALLYPCKHFCDRTFPFAFICAFLSRQHRCLTSPIQPAFAPPTRLLLRQPPPHRSQVPRAPLKCILGISSCPSSALQAPQTHYAGSPTSMNEADRVFRAVRRVPLRRLRTYKASVGDGCLQHHWRRRDNGWDGGGAYRSACGFRFFWASSYS